MNWVIKFLILAVTLALTKYIPEDGNKGSAIAFFLLFMLWIWVAGILAHPEIPGATVCSRDWWQRMEKELTPRESNIFAFKFCVFSLVGIELLFQIRIGQSSFLRWINDILKWFT